MQLAVGLSKTAIMFLTQNLVWPLGYSCLTGTFHFAKNECSLQSRLTLSNLPPDDTETILLVGPILYYTFSEIDGTEINCMSSCFANTTSRPFEQCK